MENQLKGHIATRKYKSYLKKGLKIKLVAIPGIHCQECGKLFIHKNNLIRHYLHTHVARKNYSCSKCHKQFHRQNNKLQHEIHCNSIKHHSIGSKRKLATETDTSNKMQKCDESDKHTGYGLKESTKTSKRNYKIHTTNSAFKNATITYRIKYNIKTIRFVSRNI